MLALEAARAAGLKPTLEALSHAVIAVPEPDQLQLVNSFNAAHRDAMALQVSQYYLLTLNFNLMLFYK